MSLDLMAIGDSKTVGLQCCEATNGYRDELLSLLRNRDPLVNDVEFSGVLAVSGKVAADFVTLVPPFIAGQSVSPDFILVSIGTNDIPWIRTGQTTEVPWKADMGEILDDLHAAWPDAQILLMRPMVVTYEAETATMNDVWLPAVLATRSPWAAVGPDERDFLPGHIPDNFHADAVGYSLTAAAWKTAIGVN